MLDKHIIFIAHSHERDLGAEAEVFPGATRVGIELSGKGRGIYEKHTSLLGYYHCIRRGKEVKWELITQPGHGVTAGSRLPLPEKIPNPHLYKLLFETK